MQVQNTDSSDRHMEDDTEIDPQHSNVQGKHDSFVTPFSLTLFLPLTRWSAKATSRTRPKVPLLVGKYLL